MSHIINLSKQFSVCFPRVSGDEPLLDTSLRGMAVFSPRERG